MFITYSMDYFNFKGSFLSTDYIGIIIGYNFKNYRDIRTFEVVRTELLSDLKKILVNKVGTSYFMDNEMYSQFDDTTINVNFKRNFRNKLLNEVFDFKEEEAEIEGEMSFITIKNKPNNIINLTSNKYEHTVCNYYTILYFSVIDFLLGKIDKISDSIDGCILNNIRFSDQEYSKYIDYEGDFDTKSFIEAMEVKNMNLNQTSSDTDTDTDCDTTSDSESSDSDSEEEIAESDKLLGEVFLKDVKKIDNNMSINEINNLNTSSSDSSSESEPDSE